jgi:predicted enzyme related to lactoylglutathione lyase
MTSSSTPAPAIARLACVALDCSDAHRLARFYAALTGWQVRAEADDDWVQLDSGGGVDIAFQQVADYRPPVWPGPEHPQQVHLDLQVDDLDDGESAVVALGATRHEVQPGTGLRVFLDPGGHPFCLVE